MLRTALAALLAASAAIAQPQPAAAGKLDASQVAAFEVASIRPGPPGGGSSGTDVTPGNLVIRNLRLADIVRWAYSVPTHQISGPPWLRDLRFDINAKASTPAPESELRVLLQKLLADRFHLTLHRESREMSVLVLTVAKNGHKLAPAAGAPSFNTAQMKITAVDATVSQLTDFLSNEVGTTFIDRTGLTGKFNYVMEIRSYITDEIRRNMPRDGPPLEAAGIIRLALQEQLGLKVDSGKEPVPMLIIDHIDKEPSEN